MGEDAPVADPERPASGPSGSNVGAYGTDAIWDTFLDAVVTVHVGTTVLTVGTDILPWPAPVHILTAWNPGEERPHAQNVAANERLRRDLVERGLDHAPAIGASPDGTWSEDGFAVSGLGHADAVALGAHYGQLAIYEVTGSSWAVVPCDGGEPVPVPPRGTHP